MKHYLSFGTCFKYMKRLIKPGEGVDEFYRSIHDEKYLSMLTMFGAFLNEQLVGIIATRIEGTHIALLFVDGKHHRQVIGKNCFKKYRQAVMQKN